MPAWSADERIDTVRMEMDCIREQLAQLEERVDEDAKGRMTREQFENIVKEIVDAHLATR